MELMKVTLHSDVIERFEKIFPELLEKGFFHPNTMSNSRIKEDYHNLLMFITELDRPITLELNLYSLRFHFECTAEGYYDYGQFTVYRIPEELINEIIFDARVGLGLCIQCGETYLLKTGCTKDRRIYGKCDPKNFIPFLDKEGNKVFKGKFSYKDSSDFEPHEYIPYSPERMKEHREFAKKENAKLELDAKEEEEKGNPDTAKMYRNHKYKVF